MTDNEIGKNLKGKYVIVRGLDSGVFAATLEEIQGKTVQLKDARRVWYWAGAASLSELAIKGPGKPEECKIPEEVSTIIIYDANEILLVSEVAEKAIKAVEPWTSQN